jgi:predicted outer membrane repeat protein
MYEDSFSSNTAGGGGAIFVGGSANLSVTNSTFANNEVATAGGAIFVESFTGVSGPSINLAFNTITNNTAGDSRQGSNIQNFGGGLGFFDFTGYLQTAGNVIAKNTVTQNPNHWNSTDCFADASNFSADAYPNVVGDVTGCLALQGDDGFYGTAASPFDPKLGSGAFLPVQYPGAGIQLFAVKPSAGSPLLASYQSDSVDCAISPSFDCPPVADELDQSRKKAKNGQADYGAIESTGH